MILLLTPSISAAWQDSLWYLKAIELGFLVGYFLESGMALCPFYDMNPICDT